MKKRKEEARYLLTVLISLDFLRQPCLAFMLNSECWIQNLYEIHHALIGLGMNYHYAYYFK